MLSLWSLRCGAKSGQLQDGLRGRLELRAPFSPLKRVTTDRSCGGWMASGRLRRCASPITFPMRSRASKAQNSLLRSQGATQREPSAPWKASSGRAQRAHRAECEREHRDVYPGNTNRAHRCKTIMNAEKEKRYL